MTDVEDLSVPALADELTSLAAHLAAGTARFLCLLAAFDNAEGWQGVGLRSCAQWLSWRCGMSQTTARDHLRVAHRLESLPLVRAAFGEGRLSFSKVRAISRVAVPATEAALLESAESCTAAQLDRLCGGLAKARRPDEVLADHSEERLTVRWDDDGCLRFSGRLSPEHGATLLAALASGRPDVVDVVDGREHGSARDGLAIDPGLPDDDYRDAGMLAARSDAQTLVAMAQRELNDPSDSGDPVRLIVHTTEEAMARAAGAAGAAGTTNGTTDASAEAPDIDAEFATAGILDAGPGIPVVPLASQTLGRLGCEALVEPAKDPDAPTASRKQRRFASSRQRRALIARDGGCRFPGCSRRRHLHAHHVQPWSMGGPTSMENLVLLCPHHHLLVHEGGWQIRFRGSAFIATGPQGQVHVDAPAASGNLAGLQASHRAAVTPDTVTGRWAGQPLDLHWAVSSLASLAMTEQRPTADASRVYGRPQV